MSSASFRLQPAIRSRHSSPSYPARTNESPSNGCNPLFPHLHSRVPSSEAVPWRSLGFWALATSISWRSSVSTACLRSLNGAVVSGGERPVFAHFGPLSKNQKQCGFKKRDKRGGGGLLAGPAGPAPHVPLLLPSKCPPSPPDASPGPPPTHAFPCPFPMCRMPTCGGARNSAWEANSTGCAGAQGGKAGAGGGHDLLRCGHPLDGRGFDLQRVGGRLRAPGRTVDAVPEGSDGARAGHLRPGDDARVQERVLLPRRRVLRVDVVGVHEVVARRNAERRLERVLRVLRRAVQARGVRAQLQETHEADLQADASLARARGGSLTTRR